MVNASKKRDDKYERKLAHGDRGSYDERMKESSERCSSGSSTRQGYVNQQTNIFAKSNKPFPR